MDVTARAGHAALSPARPVRLPGPARNGPSTRRCRPGSAEPARGSRRGLGHRKPTRACRTRKLKPLAGVIDTPPMRPRCAGSSTGSPATPCAPPGEVMAMALRVVAPRFGAPATGWRRAEPPPDARITEARRKVLDALARHEPRAAGDLARAAGVGAGVVRGMADAGLLVPAVLPVEPPFAIPDPEHPGQVLAPDQEAAAAALRQAVAARAFTRHAAGRRDRLRQDRGLSGGGGRMPAPGPPGAGAAAGDRAVLAMAGALRAPLRRRAGGVALRPDLAGRGA